ncbi:MAG: nuclear transport factor 2 family protein, partial [Acidimicrobiales bacterium]
MAQHPNVERVQQLSDAWARGDLEAQAQFWTEDVVWRVPGRHVLAGTYRGRDALNALVVRFFEESGGTLRLEPLDVIADDNHVICIFRAKAERGGRVLDVEDANV